MVFYHNDHRLVLSSYLRNRLYDLFQRYIYLLVCCLIILIKKIIVNTFKDLLRGTKSTGKDDDDDKFNSDNARSRKIKRTFKPRSGGLRFESKKFQKTRRKKTGDILSSVFTASSFLVIVSQS